MDKNKITISNILLTEGNECIQVLNDDTGKTILNIIKGIHYKQLIELETQLEELYEYFNVQSKEFAVFFTQNYYSFIGQGQMAFHCDPKINKIFSEMPPIEHVELKNIIFNKLYNFRSNYIAYDGTVWNYNAWLSDVSRYVKCCLLLVKKYKEQTPDFLREQNIIKRLRERKHEKLQKRQESIRRYKETRQMSNEDLRKNELKSNNIPEYPIIVPTVDANILQSETPEPNIIRESDTKPCTGNYCVILGGRKTKTKNKRNKTKNKRSKTKMKKTKKV